MLYFFKKFFGTDFETPVGLKSLNLDGKKLKNKRGLYFNQISQVIFDVEILSPVKNPIIL